MLKICKKLQEKRFVFVKILAIIIPENGAKVSKIKCLRLNQQTLPTHLNTCDISYGESGFCQVMGGLDNTLFIDVLDHGNAHFFLKCLGQVVWVNLYHVGDVLDGQRGG